MQQSEINLLPLYQYKDIYGIGIWYSLFNRRFHPDLQKQPSDISKYLINVVLQHKHKNLYRDFIIKCIETIKQEFNCNSIIVCPGHKAKLSNLQTLFNSNHFIRKNETLERKYIRGTKEDKGFNKEDFNINLKGIKYPALLVDDIITTGETLQFFSGFLKKDIIKLVMCINYKLPVIKIKDIPISFKNIIKADEFAINYKEEIYKEEIYGD